VSDPDSREMGKRHTADDAFDFQTHFPFVSNLGNQKVEHIKKCRLKESLIIWTTDMFWNYDRRS